MYIVVCTSCASCGTRSSVGLFEEKPTKKQIEKTEDLIGGMFCIKTRIFLLESGEITANEADDK